MHERLRIKDDFKNLKVLAVVVPPAQYMKLPFCPIEVYTIGASPLVLLLLRLGKIL